MWKEGEDADGNGDMRNSKQLINNDNITVGWAPEDCFVSRRKEVVCQVMVANGHNIFFYSS